MGKRILIAGFGSAGGYALEYLSRTPAIEEHEITVATRSVKEAELRVNTIRISAAIMGFYPKISVVESDLNDIDRTAELIFKLKPDIIAYTARFIKGVKYGQYSYPNQIGYGAWIALAIPLVYKLMQAVKKSRTAAKLINSSFPDGVCPALHSVGLAPFCGAGNLNHLIPRIKFAIAKLKNVDIKRVEVIMIGSHFLNTYVSRESSAKGSPYYMNCLIDGEKLSGATDEEIFKLSNMPTISGPERNMMIASDITKIIRCMLFNDGDMLHVPGPSGLAGGYPVRICGGRIELALPADITIEKAIEINKQSLAYDGIKNIEGGRIYFTDDIILKMKKVFGLTYPEYIRVEDCEAFAYDIKKALLGA